MLVLCWLDNRIPEFFFVATDLLVDIWCWKCDTRHSHKLCCQDQRPLTSPVWPGPASDRLYTRVLEVFTSQRSSVDMFVNSFARGLLQFIHCLLSTFHLQSSLGVFRNFNLKPAILCILCIYRLKERGGKGFKSLKSLFLEYRQF